MDEGFRIRLTKDGAPLRLQPSADGGGLILGGEVDSSPRDFLLEFSARSSVTAFRMRQVQRIQGWHPWEFRLELSVDGEGALSFGGAGSRTLPSGHYWIKPRLEDLRIGGEKRIPISIEEGEVSDIELEAKNDPRWVELEKPVDEWDEDIRRVLRAASSRLDGHRPDRWLERDEPRARRKACLLNLLAVLRSQSTASGALLGSVGEVFFAESDRIYSRVTADLFRRLTELAEDPARRFFEEGTPKAKVHRKLLERAEERFGVDTEGFRLRSFRAEGGPSLQVVVGIPPGVASEHLAEFDLDLGNPLQDVRGFVVHIGELLDSGRTDHLKLREKLARGPAKEFLYYRVRKT